jgi:MarR-like DNA-binding transcriptional regulator SgrR of sgrS sRNA
MRWDPSVAKSPLQTPAKTLFKNKFPREATRTMPSVHQVVFSYQTHLVNHTVADAVNETMAQFQISAADIVGAFDEAELKADLTPEEAATLRAQRSNLVDYLNGQEGNG